MNLVEPHSMIVEFEYPVPDPQVQVHSHFVLQGLPFLLTRHFEARSRWASKLMLKFAIILNLRAVAFPL